MRLQAVDLDALPGAANLAAATDYLFRRMADAARAIEARLLLVMVQNSAMIYAGRDGAQAPLNRIAAAIAKQDDVPFLDLESAFAADWQAQHRHFEFVSDHHWNEHGHIVAADAIAAALHRGGWP